MVIFLFKEIHRARNVEQIIIMKEKKKEKLFWEERNCIQEKKSIPLNFEALEKDFLIKV